MESNFIDIESLDMEARGVGRLVNSDGTPGKVIFVEGALPGEKVGYASYRRKARWEAATLTALYSESVLRVKPKCAYFGTCGGCAMQHLESTAQVAIKQRVLEDNLARLGKVVPEQILRPIHGPTWGYRYRARISVRNVVKKGGILVGFHEKKSAFVADMRSCEILPTRVSDLLMPLRALIESLSIRNDLPQIELAVGDDNGRQVFVMVLRILTSLDRSDETLLRAFSDQHQVEWWLQPKGPDTAYPFYPEVSKLSYSLPEFGIRMPFKPTDFTQVNHQINRVLVSKAVRLLDVQPGERIADFFCGLGNFTLALATCSGSVVGIEGSAALVARAQNNAIENGLANRTQFVCRNLFEFSSDDWVSLGKIDRLLIDPPREGAMAVCQAIADLAGRGADLKPSRIVYVSCNPSTLARDADILVNLGGYVMTKAGVVNMFPHTAHVESIAVFDHSDS